jgi:hypothetical protein
VARAHGASRAGALASPSPSPNAPPVSIRVIYEDDDLLAVDKPSGLSFHSDDLEGVEEGSNGAPAPGLLATIRAAQRSGSLAGSNYRGALHSVHRLDKVTSGITLFAKNKATASHLGEQFRSRRVHKYYVALSARKPSKKMGTVAGEMTRARRGAWRLVRSENKRKETPRTTVSRAGADEKPGVVPTGTDRSPRLHDGSEPSDPSEKPRQGSPATTKFVSRGLRKLGAGEDGARARFASWSCARSPAARTSCASPARAWARPSWGTRRTRGRTTPGRKTARTSTPPPCASRSPRSPPTTTRSANQKNQKNISLKTKTKTRRRRRV